jgi:drug/metabolite transporter (DMT)-like permease
MTYFLVLLLVNFMWAFQFSGAKIATERLGPVTVTLLPMALSTLLLLPFLKLAKRAGGAADERPRVRTSVRQFVILSLLGCTPAQIFTTWGVKHSLASNASVLTLTIPVMTAVMAVLLLGERMTGLRWVSFAMAIAGVLMVSDIEWDSVSLLHGGYLFGNLLLFGSCLGSAFYNSYSKRLLERFSPVEVLVYSFVVSDVVFFALMVALEPGSLTGLGALGAPVWLSLTLIALFSLCASMLLYFWVIQKIDVMQASLSIYTLPVFGVLISAITLNERVTKPLVLGGALVFLSTFLVTTYEERRKVRAVQTHPRITPT